MTINPTTHILRTTVKNRKRKAILRIYSSSEAETRSIYEQTFADRGNPLAYNGIGSRGERALAALFEVAGECYLDNSKLIGDPRKHRCCASRPRQDASEVTSVADVPSGRQEDRP